MGNVKNPDRSSERQEVDPAIVLVHGAFVDSSGWESVYRQLTKKGYKVFVVQIPTISLEGDVAATKRVIAETDEPVVLVGHSYGGAVITEAGNDPKVAGLIYVNAFALDKGESVYDITKDPVPGETAPPLLPPKEGFILLAQDKFPEAFAADVEPEKAKFMAASQPEWGLEAVNGTVSEASWKNKPSWYLIGTSDKMVPPQIQHSMAKRAGATVVEAEGSHAIQVSNPEAVISIIETAAKTISEELLIN
jgi:pimeloyl-ACP methyl ester carboxylesterase